MSSETGSKEEQDCDAAGREQECDKARLDNELVVDDLAKSFLGDECIGQDSIIDTAGLHVSQEKGIRHYVQQRTEAAKNCYDNEVLHAER
jgi:hypothetical protein